MRKRYFSVVVLFALLSCSRAPEPLKDGSTATRASLPDNPCEVITSARVSEITGLEILSANRAPSLNKIVQAQKENREPGPGSICIFQTRSDVGAIMMIVPPRSTRRAEQYWEARHKYFETFPGSAHRVETVGVDAWFSAGTAIHVLAHGDEHFTVATQMAHPQSREFVVNIAKAVVETH